MSDEEGWEQKFQAELTRAKIARRSGNEGKARVCARRAVGILVGEYLTHHGFTHLELNTYDRLQLFQTLLQVPPQIKETAGRFLQRVAPDHSLPDQIDLIAEAEWLVAQLRI